MVIWEVFLWLLCIRMTWCGDLYADVKGHYEAYLNLYRVRLFFKISTTVFLSHSRCNVNFDWTSCLKIPFIILSHIFTREVKVRSICYRVNKTRFVSFFVNRRQSRERFRILKKNDVKSCITSSGLVNNVKVKQNKTSVERVTCYLDI